MNNLYKLLQQIKENPAFYLGKPSITCLHSFLNGYLDARIAMGLDLEGSGIEGFQEWVQEKAKTKVSQSWAGIILFGEGSERKAFYRFFTEFDDFFHQNEISQSKNNNYSENLQPNQANFQPSVYDIYELLGWIKKRPSMYLGTNSITNLEMVLRGYNLARREIGLELSKQEQEFSGFQSWVQEKYGIKSSQSWAKIILFNSIDEQEALEIFFELFEEYLNRNKNEEFELTIA